MATTFGWAASPGSTVMVAGGSSADLTSGSALLGSVVFDNTAAPAAYTADLELTVTFASSPTASKPIEIYLIPALDGTNYEDTDNTTPPYNLLGGVVYVKASTSAQRLSFRNAPMGPYKYKAYIRNQTDQKLPAGWALNLFPNKDSSS